MTHKRHSKLFFLYSEVRAPSKKRDVAALEAFLTGTTVKQGAETLIRNSPQRLDSFTLVFLA